MFLLWLPLLIGIVLLLLVLRTGRALWATFGLTLGLVVVDLLRGLALLPALVHALVVFPLAGAAFWLIGWAANPFIKAAVGLAGLVALVHFWCTPLW